MTVTFSTPTPAQYEEIAAAGLNADALRHHISAFFRDEEGHTAQMFIDLYTYNHLGEEYIRTHTTIVYSKVCEEWFARLSKNDYYNDETRNPPKVIPVQFQDIGYLDGAEIYYSPEAKKFYKRHVSRREPFAKWYVCGRTMESEWEPRANLIFQNGDQQERVTYDDWNGVAAYSGTFNPDFRKI